LKVLGLCGGSGSGKGAVSISFQRYGVPSIDADKVYRDITSCRSECTVELAREFGDAVLQDGGALNRAALRSIVFSGDRMRLSRLNEISHKYILLEARKRIKEYEKSGAKYVIFDAPLLFESGFNTECDFVIAVIADPNIRIRRIVFRDGLTVDEAKARISAQLSDEYLRGHADFIIENNSDIEALNAAVDEIYKQLTEKET